MYQLFSDDNVAKPKLQPMPVPTQAIGRCHVSDIDGTVN